MSTTTIDKQTLESFRLNNFTFLQTNISSLLSKYLAARDILSLDDFSANPVIDLTNYPKDLTADSDLLGLYLFAPYCEKLVFPAMVNTILSSGKINLSDFKRLKVLQQPTIGSAYTAFSGDLSGLTTLTDVDITYANPVVYPILGLPVLSSNPNLKTLKYLGTALPGVVTIANTGNLQGNMALTTFNFTYVSPASTQLRQIVDNVLASLKTQKQNGGAISKIDFTGSPAPTAGNSDANYTWLVANGVTVTLGTL